VLFVVVAITLRFKIVTTCFCYHRLPPQPNFFPLADWEEH
jgi:hypothetical protein